MRQRGAAGVDFATLLGILAAFGLVVVAMTAGGGLRSFLDLPSFLIVVGGTLGGTLINFSLEEFGRTIGLVRRVFFLEEYSFQPRIERILNLARQYRVGDAASLQSQLDQESDPFLRQCLELLVDGCRGADIRSVMQIELNFLEDRHRRGAQIFQTMGTIAPAMGLIGTIIGLIQMLQRIETPSSIGPAMSLALVTTFYGALLAHLVFFPMAGKLRARSEKESVLKELTVEGVASMAEGVNPRLIERKLLGFLPPKQRISEYE